MRRSHFFRRKCFAYNFIAILILIAISYANLGPDQHLSSNKTQPTQAVAVSEVIDGDTLKTANGYLRLWGIDAPELHQTCRKNDKQFECGKAARLALMSLVRTGDIDCVTLDIDRYKRQVVRCMVGDMDINNMMVQSGWALEYTQYSSGFYSLAEENAKSEKRGLWDTTFTKPWEWRHSHRHASKTIN